MDWDIQCFVFIFKIWTLEYLSEWMANQYEYFEWDSPNDKIWFRLPVPSQVCEGELKRQTSSNLKFQILIEKPDSKSRLKNGKNGKSRRRNKPAGDARKISNTGRDEISILASRERPRLKASNWWLDMNSLWKKLKLAHAQNYPGPHMLLWLLGEILAIY